MPPQVNWASIGEWAVGLLTQANASNCALCDAAESPLFFDVACMAGVRLSVRLTVRLIPLITPSMRRYLLAKRGFFTGIKVMKTPSA